MLNFLDQLP